MKYWQLRYNVMYMEIITLCNIKSARFTLTETDRCLPSYSVEMKSVELALWYVDSISSRSRISKNKFTEC